MSRERFTPNDQPGWWADVPGYDGEVQASRIGEIRRVWPDGRVSYYTSYSRGSQRRGKGPSRWRFVKLKTPGGKTREVTVHKCVYTAFRGIPPKDMCIHHKNGDVGDNRLDNLALITRKELGHKSGWKNEGVRRILKIDQDGDIVQIYASAREAAKNEFMSYQSVLDRCHGRVKKPYALNGYTYQFDT